MNRILVVEDNPVQAHQLRHILEAEGFAIQVAANGAQGLDLVRSQDFDLVITDVLMPGISGFDLCRAIKDDPGTRDVPVILLTALREPADMVRGIECGADQFIPKPFRTADLLDRIRHLFAHRDQLAEQSDAAGVEVVVLGRTLTVTSGKKQILGLLLSTCEEIARTNQELQESQAELRQAKADLELANAQLRNKVRSSEDRYHAIMEQANDAIILLDQEGRLVEVNRRAEDLLGLPREHIVGQTLEQFVPEAERERERQIFRDLWSSGKPRADHVHCQRPDGHLVPVDISACVVHLGGRRLVLVIVHDTTERDRLEQQLRQSQKMEAVGQLAGGVAHDFNNLLCIITGYGELLLGGLAPDNPQRKMVEQIKSAGDRAASLTRQLLAFSRQQVIVPKILDLNAVVADTARMLVRLIGEDIEFATTLDPALGRVKADPGQVEQVLMNLVVNSRDAMPQGGKLTIETANVSMDAAAASLRPGLRPGEYVLLAVSDTGSGMDETTRGRIFEPFFSTKERGKGTGLGLAVVYGIVKQSGGSIDVYSEPGRGTTFKVYLPREAAALSREVTGTSDTPKGRETVLLVEDEAAVRHLALLILRTAGYDVLTASQGEDALRVAEAHASPIDLLITDVVMPQMSGRRLADLLTVRHSGLKVLYLSGYTDDAVVRHGILEAGVAFLQKPFSVDALARKVREVLDAPANGADVTARVANPLAVETLP